MWVFARQTEEGKVLQAEGVAETLATWAGAPGLGVEFWGKHGCGSDLKTGCNGVGQARRRLEKASSSALSRTVDLIFQSGGFQIWDFGDLTRHGDASDPPLVVKDGDPYLLLSLSRAALPSFPLYI